MALLLSLFLTFIIIIFVFWICDASPLHTSQGTYGVFQNDLDKD